MAEEPMFPELPDIGEMVLKKKDKFDLREFTIIKCNECKTEIQRKFKPGDYTYKDLSEEKCDKCQKPNTLTITEIFSEWYKIKKEKNK